MINVDLNSVIATVGVLSGILLPWFLYKRGGKAVKISEQSGIASDNRAGIGQHLSALQEDNKTLRQELKDAKLEIRTMAQECSDKISFLESKIASIEEKLNGFIRKYGNGS